jgi:hypothetical protein
VRLTISSLELENGYCVQTGSKARITELHHLTMGKMPVAIVPVLHMNGKMISVVRLTEMGIDRVGKGTSLDIKFRPVWCRLYTLYSMKKDTLLAVICEFDFGKYWIDDSGVKEAKLTTQGSGCDPAIVNRAETALSDMLDADKFTSIHDNLIRFIQKSF